MKRFGVAVTFGLCLAFLAFSAADTAGQQKRGTKAQIQRGKALVEFGGCNDCHSPKQFGPQGPTPDPARLLSGHPANSRMPDLPADVLGQDKWGALTTNDMTAWAGPWGVSFTANLTPDPTTGLGKWTEAMFIKAMRTGKHMGEGRQILPPMPWPSVASLNDADLKAVFFYLQSIKPIQNAVPDPLPPSAGKPQGEGMH